MEIVTNTASKRKTEMAVNFDRGERNFGSDAYALVSRKPKQTFTKMTTMLGKSPQEKTWHELFMLMVRGASAFECVANYQCSVILRHWKEKRLNFC